MQASQSQSCSVCLIETNLETAISLPCTHTTCCLCLKTYIETLKKYHQLKPQKLTCLTQGCTQQIDDKTINKLFKGETGFVLNLVRKRYKESKQPGTQIFPCVGYTKIDRKPLIDKTLTMSREWHSSLTNPHIKDILQGKIVPQEQIKGCTNILSFNPNTVGKDKSIQCYICGVTYCIKCLNITHQGTNCLFKRDNDQFITLMETKKGNSNSSQDNFEQFLKANQILRCLNPKCGLPIAKQQGCYWVKCRCSWEFCYPCKKLWGDCLHFSQYPYKKFVPPPNWMVKALNLY